MKVKFLLLSAFVLLSVSVSGQNANEVFKKMSQQLSDKKPLQFDTKYDLYRDAKTQTVHESYKGNFRKNQNNDVYMKIGNTEFINAGKTALKINHDQKAMVVTDREQFSTGDFDVSKLQKFCKIQSFKPMKDYWEIILVPNEFSGLTYSKIVLQVGKNYLLKKQTFFYNSGINFSNDYRKQDISKPRLEISYTNYNHNPVSAQLLNSASFYNLSKANKPMATARYKSYEIIDKRTAKLKTN